MDVETLHKAAKARYWEHKDLPGTRRLLEEGISLARTQGRADLEKPLQYDLASFCWSGWDEAGIVIEEDDLAAGEQAAWDNLRLARELNKGEVGMGNAWFILGGYHLARKRYGMALEAFEAYGVCRANDPANALLAAGYAALVFGRLGHKVDLAAVCRTLREEGGEHGPEFARQLETADRVFAR